MNGLVHNYHCGSHQEIKGIKPQHKYWKYLFSKLGTTYQQIYYIFSVIILALSISDYSLVMDIFRHGCYNLLTVYFSSSLSKRTPPKKNSFDFGKIWYLQGEWSRQKPPIHNCRSFPKLVLQHVVNQTRPFDNNSPISIPYSIRQISTKLEL